MRLLVINTGSSSVRLSIYLMEGDVVSKSAEQRYVGNAVPESTLVEFTAKLSIDAVVHRIVHGGERLVQPCVIDAAVESEIERLAVLAPLHNPRALNWLRSCRVLLGADVTQVAVFDTGFYAVLPKVAGSYALPGQLVQQHGLRRYGFHGIAHQAMWQRWRQLRPDISNGGRVISLQLGSGCSITAVVAGLPQDTSMGFSPLEGLVMATRSGDLDPGLLLYLLRVGGMSADELDQLLNKSSGLLGVAGEQDMRLLLASKEPEAQFAIELYCYRVLKYIGAYIAVMGGVDGILFGGGVGEHAPLIRERILERLQWAGIELDSERNHAAAGPEACISSDATRVAVWVIKVDEAQLLAESAVSLLSQAKK